MLRKFSLVLATIGCLAFPAAATANDPARLYGARLATTNYLRSLGCKVASGYYGYVEGAASCPRGNGKTRFSIYNGCHEAPSINSVSCHWSWAPFYPQTWVSVTLLATKVNGKYRVTVAEPFVFHPNQGGIIF